MKPILIVVIMIAITAVGSLSLILAINYESGNLENDAIRLDPKDATFIEQSDITNQEKYPQTIITELDEFSNLQTTTVILSISENNPHPWGVINGTVNNPTPGYPVILQFFKSLDEIPIHIAQVDVEENGSYGYIFRVLTIDDGIITHIFEGDYYIKIIKVVNR